MQESDAPLREMWYLAANGRALKPGRMLAKTMLGEKLVLARALDGSVFALRDFCPHRGVPFRFGRFDGREIECCFHGWRFDGTGRCTAIPALVEGSPIDPTRIRVKRFPAKEVQGNIWIFFGDDPDTAPDVPVMPDIGARAPNIFEGIRFTGSVDHAVFGLLDPGHNPFVHGSWWWRQQRKNVHDKAKAYGASSWGFTMLRHTPSRNLNGYRFLGGKPETEIVFRLPSVRIEHVRIGRHTLINLAAATPLEDGVCEISSAFYWTLPFLSPVTPIFRRWVRAFLLQDREIMLRQYQGLTENAGLPLMMLGEPDQLGRWYYLLKKEYRQSRAEGRGFANPVEDRVLHWRT